MQAEAAQGMTTADWAFVVSLFSVAISLLGFVWNVWSKFIFPKPKVRTDIAVVTVFEMESDASDNVIRLSATNYGPGQVTLDAALGRYPKPWLPRSRHRVDMFNPLHNYPNELRRIVGPYGGGLPKKLDVGENFAVFLTLEHAPLRDNPYTHVGFADSFGRYHWAPGRSLEGVRSDIRRVFPKNG